MLSDARGAHQTDPGRLPLLLIFFLSGASGLIYQVVWNRGLVVVFGSTTHATSTVLAAFMGGLAIGSLAVGRRGDRFGNPLRVYAALEAAIAVLALAVLAALQWLAPLYRIVSSGGEASLPVLTAGRFVLSCLALLPPTVLMGATLPILSSHLERRRARGGRAAEAAGSGAGALYAANTVGAVAGTALAGFLLLPALGMTGSALVAAASNLVAALAALRLARATGEPSAAQAAAGQPGRPAADSSVHAAAPSLGEGRRALLMVAFAASGAGALVFEVVWTRILSLVLGSSTQAFTIMLTTFLAGLAIGSAVATRWLPRVRAPLLAFAAIEAGAGLTAFLGLWLFPELPYSFLALYRATEGPTLLFHAGRFVLAWLVMLLPTLFLGAAFPLAARAALAGGGQVSAPIAALYAANTLGAIAGAIAAGFRFIPALGLQGTLVVGCLLNLAVAALLLSASPGGRPLLRHASAAALILALPLLVTAAPEWNGMAMTSGVFQYAPRYIQQFTSRRQFREHYLRSPQLFYRDGPTTTVTVERRPERYEGQVNMVLSVNGKVDASSTGDMDTQVLMGHLPLLASPAARDVMVIGLASGVSAGSVLAHPVEALTIVEIEPSMIEAQRFFEGLNGRPLQDPRTRLRLEDARNELLISDATYDAIISEPSNPWLSGPSKLFTQEFFELARRRLRPGGLLCQWVQLYGMDEDALKAVLRTFAAVFPHRMIFKGSPGDLLVLGSAAPIRLDAALIRGRMALPSVSADLSRVHVKDLESLLFRFRLAEEEVVRYTGAPSDGPLNTDDNGLVEFAAMRTLYREDHMANDAALSSIPDLVLPYVAWESAADRDATAARTASRLVRAGLLDRAARLIDASLEAPGVAREGRAELLASRGELLHKRGNPAAAVQAWEESRTLDPARPRAAIGLAAVRLAAGDPGGAARILEPASSHPEAAVELAHARWKAGDAEGALAVLDLIEPPGRCSGAEAGHDPAAGPFLHLHRGRILAARGDFDAARANLRLYFSLFPRTPRSAETSIDAAGDLARAALALGDRAEAIAQFRVAAGLADSLASWNRGQAEQLVARRELETAARHLGTALQWNAGDQASRRMLGYVLNDLGRHDEAVKVWRDLDRALEGDKEALRNIAGLSLQKDRAADALAAFEKLMTLEPDPAEVVRLEAAVEELRTNLGGGKTP
jgi:spermidine synthase